MICTVPGCIPFRDSSSLISASACRTSSALSHFGRRMASGARGMISSKSSFPKGVHRALTLTVTSTPRYRIARSAFLTRILAASFSETGTPSSRSSMMLSAPYTEALASIPGFVPGMYREVRRSLRSIMCSPSPVHPLPEPFSRRFPPEREEYSPEIRDPGFLRSP